MAARVYQLDQDHERRSSPDIPRSADKFFTHRVTTLVALLVVNGRRQDAEAIAQKARLELDDPAFRAAIDAALTGAVPDPWP